MSSLGQQAVSARQFSSKVIFEKVLIPAWTLEETESVALNLGKYWKNKNMQKHCRIQKRGDKEKPSQREGMCHLHDIIYHDLSVQTS